MKIELELNSDLILLVTGEYYPEEKSDKDYPGMAERFVFNYTYIKGDLELLKSYRDENHPYDSIDEMIEEECLKQIKL